MKHATVVEWAKLAEQEGMRDGIVVLCPCGQPAALGVLQGEPAAMHKSPPCVPFLQKEPDEYATYLRREGTTNEF